MMPSQRISDAAVASIVAELMYLRQQGYSLSTEDAGLLETLDSLERCEESIKSIVTTGQLTIDSYESVQSEHLPESLGGLVRQWMEKQAQWELAVTHLKHRQKQSSRRSGPRGHVSVPATIRIPTSPEATKALISIVNAKAWSVQTHDEQQIASAPKDGVRVNLSDSIGFDANTAISHLTRHGAAVVQTFLTLASIWREQAGNASYDSYIEVFASDILRHQGRQQTPKGGYHQADTLSKGRDAFILSRLVVPVIQRADGDSVTFARFVSIEQLETKVLPGTSESYVRFRFHLGEPFHRWMTTTASGSWDVAGKLLQYHPQRQKYHILLGICLSHIAWTARYERRTAMVVSLREILLLSNLYQHGHRPGAFLSSLEDAIQDLNRDGILPGIRLNKPDGWMDMPPSQQARVILERSVISLPHSIS